MDGSWILNSKSRKTLRGYRKWGKWGIYSKNKKYENLKCSLSQFAHYFPFQDSYVTNQTKNKKFLNKS